MASAGLLLLRMMVAVILLAHSLHWLFGLFAGAGMGPGGPTATTAYFAAAGLEPAFLFVIVTGLVDLVGSVLLVPGVFTRLAAAVLLFFQLVRLLVDSARWGFFLNWTLEPGRGHGMEYALLLASALACIALVGAGDWSFDGVRTRRDESRVAALARIRDRG